jgi:hypothetical protein
MRWIKRAWKGEEKLWKIFWCGYIPMFAVILLFIKIIGDDPESLTHPLWSYWLWSAHILTDTVVHFFMLVSFVITIWILKSLWACAFNSKRQFYGILARITVAISSFGIWALMGILWIDTSWTIMELECMKKEAQSRRVDIQLFIQENYGMAFPVCIKQSTHFFH